MECENFESESDMVDNEIVIESDHDEIFVDEDSVDNDQDKEFSEEEKENKSNPRTKRGVKPKRFDDFVMKIV